MDPHLSIEKTEIQGLYVVNPVSYKSDEDLIVETYNSQELLKNGLNMSFVQENQGRSARITCSKELSTREIGKSYKLRLK